MARKVMCHPLRNKTLRLCMPSKVTWRKPSQAVFGPSESPLNEQFTAPKANTAGMTKYPLGFTTLKET